MLRERAALLAELRDFFSRQGVLEVSTPVISRFGNTDPNLESLTAQSAQDDGQAPRWLHTSPEFAMKRLLAAGAGSIYQIVPVFRGGEAGRIHNPEFSMLEWYREGWSDQSLMDEVAAVTALAIGQPQLSQQRFSYRDLMIEHAAIDPWEASHDQLAQRARAHGLVGALPHPDECLDFLFSHCVSPQLDPAMLTLVHGYPASQAALAEVDESLGYPAARRFEAFCGGMELANGYQELTDAEQLQQRMVSDLARRRSQGHPLPPADQALLQALDTGLPRCAGVAMGIDRLLMLRTDEQHIARVLSFDWERA